MAATKDQQFRYEPFLSAKSEIRLIERLRTGQDDRLELELKNYRLDKARYRAVSYTWGTESAVREILLNGKRAYIRTNIHDFLVHRTTVDEDFVPLWVDAICIDQQNNAEKSDQVRMMNVIFGQAEVVLVWLGENSQTSYIIDLYHEHQKGHNPKVAIAEWFEQIFKKGNSPCASCRTLSWHWFNMNFKQAWEMEITHIEANDYWERLWIVQEIILAKWSTILVLGGTDTVSVEDFFCLSKAWERRRPVPRAYNWDLLSLLTMYRKEKPIWGHANYLTTESLSSAIELCSTQKCSERRDMVFGLLALTGSATDFKIDYQMSIGHLLYETLKVYCKEKLDTEEILSRDESGAPSLRTTGAPGDARGLRSVFVLFRALQVTFQDIIECYSCHPSSVASDILGYRYNWKPFSTETYKYNRSTAPLYELHDKLEPCMSLDFEKSSVQSCVVQNSAEPKNTSIPVLGPYPDHEILVLAYAVSSTDAKTPLKLESTTNSGYCTTELALDFGEWECSFLMNQSPNGKDLMLLGLCCSFAWQSGPHHMRVYLVFRLCSELASAFDKQFQKMEQKSKRSRRDRVHGQIACCLYEVGWFWEIESIFKNILERVQESAIQPPKNTDMVDAKAAPDPTAMVEDLTSEMKKILPQHSIKTPRHCPGTSNADVHTCLPCRGGFRDRGFFESDEEKDRRPVVQLMGVRTKRSIDKMRL